MTEEQKFNHVSNAICKVALHEVSNHELSPESGCGAVVTAAVSFLSAVGAIVEPSDPIGFTIARLEDAIEQLKDNNQ